MGKLFSEMTEEEIHCEIRRLDKEIEDAEKLVEKAERRQKQFVQDVGWTYGEGIGYMPVEGRRGKHKEYVPKEQVNAGACKSPAIINLMKEKHSVSDTFRVEERFPQQSRPLTDEDEGPCLHKEGDTEHQFDLWLFKYMGLEFKLGDDVQITARIVSRVETKRVPVE
jgi:hypothetical protein